MASPLSTTSTPCAFSLADALARLGVRYGHCDAWPRFAFPTPSFWRGDHGHCVAPSSVDGRPDRDCAGTPPAAASGNASLVGPNALRSRRRSPSTQPCSASRPPREWWSSRSRPTTPRSNSESARASTPAIRRLFGLSSSGSVAKAARPCAFSIPRGRSGPKSTIASRRWNAWTWTRCCGSFGTTSILCCMPRGRRARLPY